MHVRCNNCNLSNMSENIHEAKVLQQVTAFRTVDVELCDVIVYWEIKFFRAHYGESGVHFTIFYVHLS